MPDERIIAVDGGGTSTRAGLYTPSRRLLAEAEAGPSNPVAYGLDTTVAVLAALTRQLAPDAGTLVIGLSGAREQAHREDIARRIAADLALSHVIVTDDMRPLLFANAGDRPATLVIAGTGSSIIAQSGPDKALVVGARGGLVSDDGSAYRLAVRALRASSRALDGLGPDTQLVDALAHAAGVSNFDEIPVWAEAASKRHIADLASAVLRCAEAGDAVAMRCVVDQAERLAAQVVAARTRLALPAESPVYLHGGLILGSELYRREFTRALALSQADVPVQPVSLDGHRAVLEVALAETLPATVPVGIASASGPVAVSLPPTERVSGDGHLDAMTADEIVRAMNRQDHRAADAVAKSAPEIAAAIEAAARAIRAGGRIVYTGAGTSGRLGALDASECPPTFGVSPDRVLALMAGGDAALRTGVEDVEDDSEQGVADLAALDPPLGPNDIVVGIAASGTTPYVRAGLVAARNWGATTVLLSCNPACRDGADIVIALDTGPEALPGSTRLKAGTATKMVLNMISTGAMALSGRVYNGYMVGMRPVNAKLRRRAVRIIDAITGVGEGTAERLLTEANGNISVAVIMARRGVSSTEAERLWTEAGENLRAVLDR